MIENPASGNGGVRDAYSSSDDSKNIAAPRPSIKPTPDVPPNWRRVGPILDDMLIGLPSRSTVTWTATSHRLPLPSSLSWRPQPKVREMTL